MKIKDYLSKARIGRGIFAVFASVLIFCTILTWSDHRGDLNAEISESGCPDKVFGCAMIEGPIIIGTILNHSVGGDKGVELAIRSRGEILGHKVKWLHKKEKSPPESVGKLAHEFINNPQVAAVIGTTHSGNAGEVAPVLSDAGIVLFSPANTNHQLTEPDFHEDFYLRASPNDKFQSAFMAKYAREVLMANVAATVYYPGEDPSDYPEFQQKVFADTFRDLLGTIIAQETVDFGTSDFTAFLNAIGPVDFIFAALFDMDGALLTLQTEVPVGGPDSLAIEDFSEILGPSPPGFFVTNIRRATGAVYDNFRNSFVNMFGHEPSDFDARAFDATNMVLDAIEEVAIREKTSSNSELLWIPRKALRDKLFSVSNYQGAGATYTCDENGDCDPKGWSVYTLQNGKFVEIWTSDL